jgi:hypothetical protein
MRISFPGNQARAQCAACGKMMPAARADKWVPILKKVPRRRLLMGELVAPLCYPRRRRFFIQKPRELAPWIGVDRKSARAINPGSKLLGFSNFHLA